MLTFDEATLNKVIATAKQSAAGTPWESRIERAAIELTTNPYIAIAGDHLLIGSPSGNSYSVNGSCQCRAFEVHNPCWHRAAKQLVARYLEAVALEAQRKYTCRGCGEKTLEPGMCYGCMSRGPKRDPKPYNRPLGMFTRQDQEAARLAAKGEMRAQLEQQAEQRKAAAAKALELVNELF
jgi:hypothetical protein